MKFLNWFQSDYMTDREEIYKDRNRRIEEVCKNYKNIYKRPQQGRLFFFDFPHNLAVCLHAKVRISLLISYNVLHLITFQVGSSTWKRNMLLLSDKFSRKEKMLFDTPDEIHRKVRPRKLLPDLNQVCI